MKTYEGERTLRGVKVTVNGAPLPPRTDLRNFNRTGFEWTYAGPGPQQLSRHTSRRMVIIIFIQIPSKLVA